MLLSFGVVALLVVVFTRGRLGYQHCRKKKNPLRLQPQREEGFDNALEQAPDSHRRAQRNAFRRCDAHLQSRSFDRWNQSLRRSSNSNRLC